MNDNNFYKNILKQHNIDTTEQRIFPLFRKSTYHKSIVKFTDKHNGYIVRESHMRNPDKHGDNDGTLGKLGSGESNKWVAYDDKNWWSDLTHEELLEFDENYRNKHLLETKNNISKELIDSLLNLENLSSNNEFNRISNLVNLLSSLNKGTEL